MAQSGRQQASKEASNGKYADENHRLLGAIVQHILEESAVAPDEAALRIVERMRQGDVETGRIEQQ
ncbi:hypothetical protein D3C72_2521840 [compost metagenome]